MSAWEVFLQQLIIGLSNGMIIALIALGYTMVYGIIELINFAHGDLFMLGSFCALTLVSSLTLGSWAQDSQPQAPSASRQATAPPQTFKVDNFTKANSHFPNLIAPYKPHTIPAPNLSNAPRIESMLARVTPGIEADTHAAIRTGQLGSKFGMSPAAACPSCPKPLSASLGSGRSAVVLQQSAQALVAHDRAAG